MLKKTGSIQISCPDKNKLTKVGEEALRKQFGYDCIINAMDFIHITRSYYNVHYEVE